MCQELKQNCFNFKCNLLKFPKNIFFSERSFGHLWVLQWHFKWFRFWGILDVWKREIEWRKIKCGSGSCSSRVLWRMLNRQLYKLIFLTNVEIVFLLIFSSINFHRATIILNPNKIRSTLLSDDFDSLWFRTTSQLYIMSWHYLFDCLSDSILFDDISILKIMFYNMGSVYFVVNTALSADTKRKCQMAERKTVSNFGQIERLPKALKPLTTPNKRPLITQSIKYFYWPLY